MYCVGNNCPFRLRVVRWEGLGARQEFEPERPLSKQVLQHRALVGAINGSDDRASPTETGPDAGTMVQRLIRPETAFAGQKTGGVIDQPIRTNPGEH